jgi:hypothetical protein
VNPLRSTNDEFGREHPCHLCGGKLLLTEQTTTSWKDSPLVTVGLCFCTQCDAEFQCDRVHPIGMWPPRFRARLQFMHDLDMPTVNMIRVAHGLLLLKLSDDGRRVEEDEEDTYG